MIYQFQHFGISEYFCKEYGENFNFPLHLHQGFELLVVLEGEMQVQVDNTLYSLWKGQSILIFPNQIHSIESRNSKHVLCIFSTDLVQAYFSKMQHKKPVSNRFVLDAYLVQELDNLLSESSSFEKKGILYSICAAFDKGASYEKRMAYDDSLLHTIFAFVEENFEGDCELNDLARKTGYSYSYLSRCFKKITGISFNTYVNRFRVSNACYLLNNTQKSILECALESGYKSIRSFNRNFMSVLAITPKEYRARMES